MDGLLSQNKSDDTADKLRIFYKLDDGMVSAKRKYPFILTHTFLIILFVEVEYQAC